MIVERRVKYLMPGSFFAEDGTLAATTIDDALALIPRNAYAFQFYERTTQKAKCEDGTMIDHTTSKIVSPWYFPGGKLLKLDDIPDTPEYRILRSNMECNRYDVIRTRLGNHVPAEKDSVCL